MSKKRTCPTESDMFTTLLGIGGVGTQGCCLVQVLPWQNGSMYFARANIQHFAWNWQRLNQVKCNLHSQYPSQLFVWAFHNTPATTLQLMVLLSQVPKWGKGWFTTWAAPVLELIQTYSHHCNNYIWCIFAALASLAAWRPKAQVCCSAIMGSVWACGLGTDTLHTNSLSLRLLP